jgi:cardiolipin synthase
MVAWIGATLFLPFLGPALYLIFGTDRLRRRRLKRHRQSKRRSQEGQPDGPIDDFTFSDAEKVLVSGISRINEIPLTGIDSLDILEDADDYYGDLLEHLREAKHHIHIQTYVWRDDETGRQFLDAICEAAKRGVKVRLLIDELGSFDTDEAFFQPLISAGGEFSWFYTIHPRRNRYFLNLRNHRKLQIIDGNRAYIGGMNVGRDYEGKDPELGEWRDLQVCVTGAAVNDLQEIFANDWFFATEREFSGDDYFAAPARSSTMPALFVESGPDSERKPFLKSVILLCNYAGKSIDLFTPYFVPVSSLVAAFQIAAARGVRVRLMISEKNDHRYLVKIGRSYYEELMEFGVEIYEYSEAIHHAKAIIVDDRWLMVGSANLDARSIDLNFELNLLLRSEKACTELNKTYSEMFASSKRLELEEFRKRPRMQKLGEGLSRLWAPLL